MKLAICNELFEKWELERVISFCADMGWDGIEVAPFTLADLPNRLPSQKRKSLFHFAENHHIHLIGLHWLLAGPPGLSISFPNKEMRQFTQSYLMDLIDLCSDLGGDRMVFGSPHQRSVGEGQPFNEVWKYAVDIFQSLMPRAESSGVTICYEPLSPLETNFINTAEQGRKLLKAVDHPNFKLHLDVKAMSYEKKPIPDIIRESGDVIGHFHLNDKQGHEPGYGDLDFEPIINALRDVAYDDYISVEAFDFTDGAETIASRSYEYLGRLI
ncbi:sugar phosphate isomerase/epimerase [candidate division KSB1 bacterium]|nr:sugar phosphate isomerase/epimerase [candidate division KSB1 bacterium]